MKIICNVSDLSTDQDLLLKFCNDISAGIVPIDLACRKPGPLTHSRWLTAAIRILRLYVATIDCPSQLLDLATFIVKVYAPVWFSIKCKSFLKDGPIHLWKMIQFSRYLPNDQKTIVDRVIQTNAYFAHPENILLAMVFDDREHIRMLGLKK